MRILFKFATRSRPQLFERGIKSIIDNCESDDYKILVSIDFDDQSMLDHIKGKEYKNTEIIAGTSKNKIDAINRDIDHVKDWDILVNMSDDMVFIRKGFDNIIRREFTCGFDLPEIDLSYCLHFSDGNRNDLITMSILGREFYDGFGYIYHPDYKSLWCDNEQTDVSKQLGCYKYVDEQILRHLHPAYNSRLWDAQYVKTEAFNAEDKATYLRRKLNNFDL